MLFSFWFDQTKLHRLIAINHGVREASGLGEQLTADETFAQSVTTHYEQLADLVGAPVVGSHAPPFW
jgi:hypothetical protein